MGAGVGCGRLAAAVLLLVPALAAFVAEPIDRRALVTRHNPRVRHVDADAPLTVGNGGFAFTADITGLRDARGGMPSAVSPDPNPVSLGLSLRSQPPRLQVG